MSKYTSNEKNKLIEKLEKINITNEKDVLNLKVSDLKKINKAEDIQNITLKDIQIIWLMQEAIETKNLFKFFTNSE